MRATIMATAGLIAAILATSGAQAGKGGGASFAICDSANQQYLPGKLPDTTPQGGFDASYTLSREDVAAILRNHWPRLGSSADARTIFDGARAYGKGSKDTHELDENTLGLIYDMFEGKAGIGEGYLSHADGPNTALNADLLREWSSSSAPTGVVCHWKDPKGRKPDQSAADNGHGLLKWLQGAGSIRSGADTLEQALAHKTDSVFLSPKSASASLAFTHDQLDHTANTFTMHAALGLGQKWVSADAWHIGLLEYVGTDRINNSDPKKQKNNSTDIYAGAGLVWTYHPDGWGLRAGAHLQADTDDKFGASMAYLGGQISGWAKGAFCLDSDGFLIGGLVRVKCEADVDLDYAHIFNSGDFINLTQREYARGGGEFTAKISGPEVSDTFVRNSGNPLYFIASLLSHLSYTANYKVLGDMTGSSAALSRFDSSFDYNLGGSDDGPSTSVSLKYVNGRADRTLEKERAWSMSLNISY